MLWAVSYALHAALGIQQAFAAYAEELWRTQAITLDMRMGVAAGTVAIGVHQNDRCLDYTSQGFALYLADRLQALATGSTLHVSEAIQQRALGFFRFKNLGVCCPVWHPRALPSRGDPMYPLSIP